MHMYLISDIRICSSTLIDQSLNCDFRVGASGSKTVEYVLKISVSEHLPFIPDVCSLSSLYHQHLCYLCLLLKGELQKEMMYCM